MSQEKTQNLQILNYLKKGKTITQVEAYHKFGCWRLSARIFDLRKEHDIKTVHITDNGKTYAQYSLVIQ